MNPFHFGSWNIRALNKSPKQDEIRKFTLSLYLVLVFKITSTYRGQHM